MTLVLDTSALVALHVTGTARAVVRDAMEQDSTWCASALAMTEALAVIDRLSDDEITRIEKELDKLTADVVAEIDTMLERLKTLSDEHFHVSPDDINWGHVGTLAHYAELLKRITDAAFKEGEHAA